MNMKHSMSRMLRSACIALGLSFCAMHAQARLDWLYELDETSASRPDMVVSGYILVTDDAHQNGFSLSSSYWPTLDNSGPFDLHGMGIDDMFFNVGGFGVAGISINLDSFSEPASFDYFPGWQMGINAGANELPTGEIHYTNREDASNFNLYLSGSHSHGEFFSDAPMPLGFCSSSGNGPNNADCYFDADFHLVGQVNVPEPSNLALFGLGMSALALATFRRRKLSRGA